MGTSCCFLHRFHPIGWRLCAPRSRPGGSPKTNGALRDYRSPCPVIALLQRHQVLDQVAFFLLVQPEPESPVVVPDDVPQGCEATVVEETALVPRPQSPQRRAP